MVSKGEAVKILTSASYGIRSICPNRERHRNWTMAERHGS